MEKRFSLFRALLREKEWRMCSLHSKCSLERQSSEGASVINRAHLSFARPTLSPYSYLLHSQTDSYTIFSYSSYRCTLEDVLGIPIHSGLHLDSIVHLLSHCFTSLKWSCSEHSFLPILYFNGWESGHFQWVFIRFLQEFAGSPL